jgi:hypothetical protein
MDIEHLPQAFLVFERIAGEIESNAGADGAPCTQEIVIRGRFDNQFGLVHASHDATGADANLKGG